MNNCPHCGHASNAITKDQITFPETKYVGLPELAKLSELEEALGVKLVAEKNPMYGFKAGFVRVTEPFYCHFSGGNVWRKIENGMASLSTHGKTENEAMEEMLERIQGKTLILSGEHQGYSYNKIEVKINQIHNAI